MRKAAFSSLLLLVLAGCTQVQGPDPRLAFDDLRIRVPLTEWSFYRGTLDVVAATGAGLPATTQGDWQDVKVPHTWNNIDGQDGGNNYVRGDGWYRRVVWVTPEMAGKSLYLRFEGANRRADMYVNGTKVGEHIGGTQAFAVDITAAAKAGDNLVAVRVNNARDDTAPLQADFTFFGGIYRPAELIAVPGPIHFAATDYASAGAYITTPEVSPAAAKVRVKTLLKQMVKELGIPVKVRVEVLDAAGKKVAEGITIANTSDDKLAENVTEVMVPRPHLWQGVEDPYLYSVRISVLDSSVLPNKAIDAITQPLGIRTFTMDRDRGFRLNGKPYRLVGVNRHQDRKDMGWALTKKEHDEDMALIKEMGCTSIRLAHYQHAEYFYQLCDREGMVVWAEIPVVDRLGTSPGFTQNARQQYIELIRQNFNHPSIVFWSAGNEVDADGGNFNPQGPRNVYDWFKEMHALGKEEDPSRLTAAAWRERYFPPADTTDVAGLNVYFGWYNNTFQELEGYVQRHHENNGRGNLRGKWSMAEYGAGSSIYFHSENPVRMDHTEEYQNIFHEAYWKVLKEHPEVWGAYVWNMFDFAVDGRLEGDHAGINDKGLVTHDRKVKKDAFYFYKANWVDAAKDPFVYLTSKRFAVRGLEKIPVKVYTNAPRATLTMNGVSLGEKAAVNGTIVWEGVALKQGANQAQVSSRVGGKTLSDQATWMYTPGAPAEVYEAQDERMRAQLRNGPPRAR